MIITLLVPGPEISELQEWLDEHHPDWFYRTVLGTKIGQNRLPFTTYYHSVKYYCSVDADFSATDLVALHLKWGDDT